MWLNNENVQTFRKLYSRFKTKATLLFFLRLPSSDQPKFLVFSKKKGNDVVTPFFTWKNSFNLKMSIEKNRNENTNIFHSILYILLIQICEC